MVPRDAVEQLEHDHREARDLFNDVLQGGSFLHDKGTLFAKLARELRAHIAVERDVFYPRVAEVLGQRGEDIDTALNDQRAEEGEGARLLDDLERAGVDTPGFDDQLRQFRDLLLRHATEVEEAQLFPRVRRHFTARQLEALGREMAERKRELLRELASPATG